MKKPQFNNDAGSDNGGAQPKGLHELSDQERADLLNNMSNETVDNKKNPPTDKPADKPANDDGELILEDPAAKAAADKAAADKAAADKAAADAAAAGGAAEPEITLTDYTEIAKELELPEAEKIATKESLVTAYKSKVEKVYEEQRSKVIQDLTNLTGFSPEAQYYIHKVNSAPKEANIGDLIDPGARFDKFIEMNDAELVSAHLRTAKIPEASIPIQVQEMTTNGQLATMAEEIRTTLKNAQTELRTAETASRTKFIQDQTAAVLKQEVEFNNKVVDNIMKTTTFEEFKVPEATRKIIAARFQDPKSYRERLSKDPDFVAKLIVQNELMSTMLNQVRKASKSAGVHEQKKAEHDKHYNPESIKKSTPSGGSGGGDPENPFGQLVSDFQSGKDVTIV